MKFLVFDVDGVLAVHEEYFTQTYARSRGLDPERFEEFFTTQYYPFLTGEKDLKESIKDNPDLWQWDKDIDELLLLWHQTEDKKDEGLLKLIAQLRNAGFICCIATDQEKYRGRYIKEIMFPGLFDKYFVSSDLGYRKSDKEYFFKVVEDLQARPKDIIFFDDRQSNVDVATSCGIDARLYTSTAQVEELIK